MLNLNSEIADFIQQGVAAAVSACDAGLCPSMARVVGARVAEEGRRITVLLRRDGNAALLRDARPGQKLAAVFCLPENERAIQIKGTLLSVEAPRSDDWPRVVAHRIAFADQIEPKGYQREFSDYYHAAERDDLVALSFAPEAVFEQTPGPQAGRCMAGA
jgi:hypothetical protein